ncbi:MAG: hypothetical protein FJ087_08605, partial [Deltaproteobacteria bacterium]|nr:hypothetical protein [Deltaproteobacteria bacterium]
MQQPILMQDWVTLRGDGAAAVTFLPHRRRWMWSGDAQAVAVVTEIRELDSGGAGDITLRLATSASENGPWFTVKTWTAPITAAPGAERLYLLRDPTCTAQQQFLGYLRWELNEAANTGAWKACFR